MTSVVMTSVVMTSVVMTSAVMELLAIVAFCFSRRGC
jgi:hypothetical protein